MLLLTLGLLMAQDPKMGRHLVFNEDFKEKTLNLKDWSYDDGPVYNNELEHYTSETSNSELKNGQLIITARKDGDRVTSARIVSRKTWKYGYFEFKCQTPSGKGTWPAVWMLNQAIRETDPAKRISWPACGEVDIMENVGYDPDAYHFSVHSATINWQGKSQRTSITNIPNASAKPHVFGYDWRSDSLTFYIDGKKVYHVEKDPKDLKNWPFDSPFFLIMNLAIGGSWGGSKGVDNSIFPAQLKIDYVKIYQ